MTELPGPALPDLHRVGRWVGHRAEVWTDESKCLGLDSLVEGTCRRFVGWVEHGKYEREIIYDRPPYTDFAKD